MNLPVTDKPSLICPKNGKVNEANRKPFFRNKLQSFNYAAPLKSLPTHITTSIVVVRIIIIFSSWIRKVFANIERFLGSVIHVIVDSYSCEDNIFPNQSIGRLTSSTERNIYRLTLYFPMFPFDPPENIRKPKIF